MLVKLIHTSGKVYLIEANQVSVHLQSGEPVACSYEQAGFMIHSDRSHDDFDRVVTLLGLETLTPQTHA